RHSVGDVAFAGGTFANIKANMQIRNLDRLKHWYVFPHMGDGGMALGAALYANYLSKGASRYRFNAYMGNEYTENETEDALKRDKSLVYQHEIPSEQASHAAELISEGNYVFWFRGRME